MILNGTVHCIPKRDIEKIRKQLEGKGQEVFYMNNEAYTDCSNCGKPFVKATKRTRAEVKGFKWDDVD